MGTPQSRTPTVESVENLAMGKFVQRMVTLAGYCDSQECVDVVHWLIFDTPSGQRMLDCLEQKLGLVLAPADEIQRWLGDSQFVDLVSGSSS